jgi:hypothetical protein
VPQKIKNWKQVLSYKSIFNFIIHQDIFVLFFKIYILPKKAFILLERIYSLHKHFPKQKRKNEKKKRESIPPWQIKTGMQGFLENAICENRDFSRIDTMKYTVRVSHHVTKNFKI